MADVHRTTSGKEIHKLFNNMTGSMGSDWEQTVLDGVRRVSEPLAVRMLQQIGLGGRTTTPFHLFDNACGPGVVVSEIQKLVEPEVLQQSSILCGDFADMLIGLVGKRIDKEGWLNTKACQVDSQSTGIPDKTFTHVTVNIGFHVIPDSEAALNETLRILKPGGTLAFTTWHEDGVGWVKDLQSAFSSFPFEAPFGFNIQTTNWGHWSDVNWIQKTLVEKGLEDVKVDVFSHLSRVDSAEHFVSSFSMMVDWTMNTYWSEELKKAHGREEVMELVKDFLEEKYDGRGWHLTWTSIIASGRVTSAS